MGYTIILNHEYNIHTLRTLIEIIEAGAELIDEIYICVKNNADVDLPLEINTICKIIHIEERENVAQIRNRIAAAAKSKYLCFINTALKLSGGWLDQLRTICDINPKSIVCPVIYDLDTILWSTKPNRYRRPDLNLELDIVDGKNYHRPQSACITPYCFIISKELFDNLGGFDESYETCEDIEISLRNYFNGGDSIITDEVSIAAEYVERSIRDIDKAKIVETYFRQRKNIFYDHIKQVNVGRIKDRGYTCSKETEYCNKFMPNLNIYDLKDIAHNKNIGIVYPGASLDYIEDDYINTYDILISVDYAGLIYKSDYVLTKSLKILNELREFYNEKSFVIPRLLEDIALGRHVSSEEVSPSSYYYDSLNLGDKVEHIRPPFANYDNISVTAIHLALFMRPRAITIFGYDDQLINGKSHTSRLEQYNNGMIYSDSEYTKRTMEFVRSGFRAMRELAIGANIPLARHNHV